MRTSIELLQEAQAEAGKFDALEVVADSGGSPVFITVVDLDTLSTLNRVICEGGQPVGMVGTSIFPHGQYVSVKFYSRLFMEYAKEAWAQSFLHKVVAGKAEEMKTSRAAAVLVEKGWL